jgi:hypothetical protein
MKNCDAIVVEILQNYVSSDKLCISQEGKREFHDMYAVRSDPICVCEFSGFRTGEVTILSRKVQGKTSKTVRHFKAR